MALPRFCSHITPYKLYALILCLLAYLLNQLDRYLLPILSLHMAQDLQYGDQACLKGSLFNSSVNASISCASFDNKDSCSQQYYFGANKSVCEWNYNGQGILYQILAGPVFIIVYTFSGIFIGYLTVFFRRKVLLAFFILLWSAFTALSGSCQSYWQLVLTRFGLGIGEAGCTPFATAIIADLFPSEVRGGALGIYNFGIYIGYSMSYAFGNFLYDANIMGQGWRWVFYISAIPGIPVALLILFTIREKKKEKPSDNAEVQPLISSDSSVQKPAEEKSFSGKLKELFFTFLSPPLLMLCFAGSIRNSGGYVWGVNTQIYFQSIGQTSQQIGSFMSWIPLVGGSLGAVIGGFISDRFVVKRGIQARMFVLVISQICAAPFALLALLLSPPYGYIMLIPSNLIGEMWIGVCLTCVLELVPEKIRPVAVAYYLFIITNIGGNIPLLVPPLKAAFAVANPDTALRNALIVLFPGMYLLSAFLFVLAIIVFRIWTARLARAPLARNLPWDE